MKCKYCDSSTQGMSVCDSCFDKWYEEFKKRTQITFPIQVDKITYSPVRPMQEAFDRETGMLVSIRPCDDEKTYLGIYIGDVATKFGVQYNEETKELLVRLGRYNPAFFVPKLKRIVYGAESWWSEIENEEQLREITDETIQNQWYVKMLKEMIGEA